MGYAPETIADPTWIGLADPEAAPICLMTIFLRRP
jgi:hypothetical protein